MSEVQNHHSPLKKNKSQDKSTDIVQKDLRLGFQWTVQHSKSVAIVVGVFLLIGAAISAKTYFNDKAENQIQAEYYKVEKAFSEKKAKFEQAEEATKASDAAKNDKSKAAKKTADKKQEEAKAIAEALANKASGDFEKDYGTLAQDLNKIIEKAPTSKAAKMAALNLSGVQVQYKKAEDAKATLSKVFANNSSDLLSGMVAAQLGTVQANQNDCAAAITTWQKVLANSSAKALHGEIKLKQGLCYESLKDYSKAEQAYSSAMQDDKEGNIGKTAEKYLRLMKSSKQ